MTRALPAILVAVVGCNSEEITGETDATEEFTEEPDVAEVDIAVEDISVECDDSKMVSYYLASDPWGVDSHCDDVGVCITRGIHVEVYDLFPDAVCDEPPLECTDHDSCTILRHGRITPEQWVSLCELSLRDGVHEIYCSVFGP
jgi:hypothetical protein